MYSFMLFFILIFLTACLILWKRRGFYYVSYKLKGPFALPCIGNGLDIKKHSEAIVEKFMEDRKKYGSPYRLWVGTRLYVYTSNPDDFQVLLNSPDALNKQDVYVFFKPIGREGLFTCSDGGDKTEHSLILCEKLAKKVGRSFDVHSLLAHCHVDIICETSTGVKTDVEQEASEYIVCFDRLCEIIHIRMLDLFLYPDFIFNRTTLGKEQEKVINYIKAFNKNVIYFRKQLLPTTTKKRKVFLDYLMETGQFTADEVDVELITLIFGGTDTVSTSESFTLILLGVYQAVQAKVFEEQAKIFGDDQREITHTDLSEMKYLERVIKESMRLFPVGAMIFRTITNDIQLSTCTLPQGTTVVFGVLDAHRNPNIWENPLKFDPDRFLPERIARQHSYSYIPFSAGPRVCLGQKYGMMVMKVILSTIVRKYKIYCEYKRVEDIEVNQNFIISPKDGYKISLEIRN